jgi:hypothetical protein
LTALYFLRRALSRRRPPERPGAPEPPAEATPRDQMVALSATIRQALADKLGPAWRAKTTEEVAIDRELETILGRDHLEELSRFLDRVDHLKFALDRSNSDEESLERQLAQWQPRVAELTAKIRTESVSAPESAESAPRRAAERARRGSQPDGRFERRQFSKNGPLA